ncbi:MAG: ATP-binding protein [Luteimonas sp.]
MASPELIQSVRAQASLRLQIGLAVLALMLAALSFWGPTHPETRFWEVGVVASIYILYSLATFYASRREDLVAPRDLVIVTAVIDPLILSVWLLIAGQSSLLIVGFYLFTILGFGFRIGTTSMHVCQAVSFLGLGVVAMVSPIWQANPFFALSHLVLLLVVPLYAGLLIKKLKAARAAAERASLAKSQLLAKVSHELRTPLTGIVSTASLIEAMSTDTESVSRAHSIIDLAMGLDLEIKQLLDLSRIESGRDEQQNIQFNMSRVAEHISRTLAPVAAAKQLDLQVLVDPQIPDSVLGDAYALNSVLMNLAGNAVKFTGTGSVSLKVELLAEDNEACSIRFSVSDTGIGIPSELQQKVFEPFFQVETGPVRKYGGTGLGTSIALAHVRRMGGELQLESTPGTGSRFWFDLRLARAKPAAFVGTVAAAPKIVRGKRILVADDNRTNLVLIREMLERDGHQVLAVDSGQTALEALATEDFELVFLDFNMHDVDGANVYETYRFGRLDIAPTYFVTADTTSATNTRLESLGAAGVIHKPVTFEKLRTAVARHFPQEAVAAPVSAQRPTPHLRPVPVEYLDPAAIETLREVRDSPEFLCKMIADGVSDIEGIDSRLSAALLDRDLVSVHRHAHALRGVSLSVGAVRLGSLADRFMSISQRDLDSSATGLHADLRRALDLSLAALDALRQSLASQDAARAG